MTTDVLLVANDDDEWPAGVRELVGHRLSVARVNASEESTPEIDCSSVRILVGGPSNLVPWINRCPKLEWIQSTWAGVDALAGHIPAGVVVTPLKHVFGQSMSEFVLGWILALERPEVRQKLRLLLSLLALLVLRKGRTRVLRKHLLT